MSEIMTFLDCDWSIYGSHQSGKCQGIKKLSGKSGKMGIFPQMSGKNDSLEMWTKILEAQFYEIFC